MFYYNKLNNYKYLSNNYQYMVRVFFYNNINDGYDFEIEITGKYTSMRELTNIIKSLSNKLSQKNIQILKFNHKDITKLDDINNPYWSYKTRLEEYMEYYNYYDIVNIIYVII